jgi:hypothetical protein
MEAAQELLESARFHSGLFWGLAGVVALALVAMARRSSSPRPVPFAGVAFAAAGFMALSGRNEAPDGLLYGLGALLAAGVVADLTHLPWIARVPLAIPGALLIAGTSEVGETSWAPTAVVAAVVVGGSLVAPFDGAWRDHGPGPLLLGISMAGVYLTVPDTERALLVFGAALPLAGLGWPVRLASLGGAGSMTAVGLLSWTAAADGFGRPSSIVGGLACVGLMVAEPLAADAVGRAGALAERLRGVWWAVPALAAGHVVLVFIASRVAGVRDTVEEAVFICGATLVVAIVVLAVVTAAFSRPRQTGRAPRRSYPTAYSR